MEGRVASKNKKAAMRRALTKKKNKDVLELINKDMAEASNSFLLDINSHNKLNSEQNKQQFFSNFCELLKNHQFSIEQEPLETRVNNSQFSSDFTQFLNKYGVGFATEQFPSAMNPYTKGCAKRTLEELTKYDPY